MPRVKCQHTLCSLLIVIALASPAAGQEKPTALFDGQSLDGWEVPEGEQKWWRVENGAIAGGSLTEKVPRNTFFSTRESFQNFDLTLKIRIRGAGGFVNSGIQIRSKRNSGHGMTGYQVDAGDGWWGKLYDEHRRKKVIAEPANEEAVNAAVRPEDWNEYRILAKGKRIRSWINGVPAVDYQESDPRIPLDGRIGIQVHGGGKALVEVKDVAIRRLPPTPGATTWAKARSLSKEAGRKRQQKPARIKPARQQKQSRAEKVRAQLEQQSPPRSPEEELRGFTVPDGFEVELVASESDGIGKFVAVAFDARGRLWTMTAMEYPVDANENPAASKAMFERGGCDKVLIIDEPFGKNVSKPRVFADGLVMPLGILPYQDGAYVQYGSDIRFYRDTNGDGKADKHEVVLTGFGTQDSHLFPHQFTRAPGGWILMAQGLFNYSKVRRPNGKPFAGGRIEIPFNQCKLARFTPSGSDFEVLTAGPNNIWGLTISREGEIWIQEANDLGYPIIPYEPGGHYKTGSKEKLKTYQPMMPPTLAPPQMGGTGLSGLALADDVGSPFAQAYTELPDPPGLGAGSTGKPLRERPQIFYVANPITNSVQVIEATPDGNRYSYQKRSDFLVSKDAKFRPVAVQFGPDGCLYVTDWYNKIISHNEVPRDHPERDKTRGRIWRIRHKSQPHTSPVNLKAIAATELIGHLGASNARVAEMAWQEIVDRDAVQLAPRLRELAGDAGIPADKRLGALWALEGIATVPTTLLQSLACDANANLRREAVRIAAAQPRPTSEFLAVARPLVDDPSPRVRAALGDALRRVPDATPELIELMLKLGKAPLPGDSWESYDRSFERFLARWAMEKNSDAVAEFLASDRAEKLPVESRALATLAIGGRQAAIGLAELIPQLKRPLAQEEIRILIRHFGDPHVAAATADLLKSPDSRDATLQMLLKLRTELDSSQLKPAISTAAQALWQQATSERERRLALSVAGAFQLHELDSTIAQFASAADTPEPMKRAALRSLRELGSNEFEVLAQMASSSDESQAVRDAALTTLAESPSPGAAETLAELLVDLNYDQRKQVIERMATSRAGASALLTAIESGDISPDNISPQTLQTMRSLLPDNRSLENLWERMSDRMQRVLRLSGGGNDYVQRPITLSGPFTVESWVKLSPGISNEDGILCRPRVCDMNFHGGRFRVWTADHKDIVTSNAEMIPGTWTHLAVSRDENGTFRIYINGELSARSSQQSQAVFEGLQIGRTTAGQGKRGTEGALTEYRIWNVARSSQQIRDNFDRSFSGDERPAALVHYFDGADWGELSGDAQVVPTLDAPQLLTAEQAREQAELFDKYRALASRPGDPEAGRALFEKTCLTCHKQGGKGGNIGPPLDGIGLGGTEALLRHILTPSAAMEGGYRQFRVLTFSGRIHTGMLVSQDESAVVLRQPDVADKRIEKADIQSAGFTSTSVMPSGLLENLSDDDVSNLFAYLLSLKPKHDELSMSSHRD